jgi:hypothetical protein
MDSARPRRWKVVEVRRKAPVEEMWGSMEGPVEMARERGERW